MLTELSGVHVEPLCQSYDLVIVNISVVFDLLRNSCKVKQNEPMQKDFSGQVSIVYIVYILCLLLNV